MSDNHRIQIAAAHIDAVQISPLRWAHRDEGTRSWWVVSRAQLLTLADMLEDPDQDDAYSHWCAGHCAREMPDGWHPDDV